MSIPRNIELRHRFSGVVGTIRKIGTWGFVAFLIFFVAFRPDSAAKAVRQLAGLLAAMANGFGTFLSQLF
jgi:hypothetical protein